jgi:hypothetical protein
VEGVVDTFIDVGVSITASVCDVDDGACCRNDSDIVDDDWEA